MSDTDPTSRKAPLRDTDPAASAAKAAAAGDELKVYREAVTAAMEAASNPSALTPHDVIYNRSAEHAAIIVEHLFRAAKERVMIVSSRLDTKVYGVPEVIDAATSFLNNNPSARIDVLIETDVDSEAHPWLSALRAVDKNRVSVTRLPSTLVARYKYNFAVADGRHYRIEQDREKFDAFAQFGNREIGKELVTTFNSLKLAA
jgi:hypothetical protein